MIFLSTALLCVGGQDKSKQRQCNGICGNDMVYRLRGQTIEIVFADVKEHRGFRRFSGRGLGHARTELALEVLLHNLIVFHRSLSQRHNAKASNSTTENIAA
jgi:Transposase DDE domain